MAWIGGKFRQAKWIYEETIKNVLENGNIKTYVEPFSGMFWNYLRTDIYKSVNNVYYNDKNKFLVNLFYCVKYKRNKMLNELKKLKPNNEELFEYFKNMIIENENKEIENCDITLAVAYAYVQTHMFNGNKITKNTKIAKNKSDNPLRALIKKLENKDRNVKNFTEKIDKVSVNNKDYKQIIKELDSKDTLFYLDPPYFNKEDFYAFNDFGKQEHKKLAELLKNIKGKFVLSYYYFKELEEYFPRNEFYYFEKEFTKTSSIKRERETEILITNFNPADYVVNNVNYKTKTNKIITQKNIVANSKSNNIKKLFKDLVKEIKKQKELIKEVKELLQTLTPVNNVNYKKDKKVVNSNIVKNVNVEDIKSYLVNSINKVVNVKNVKVVNNVNYTNKKVKFSYSKVLLNNTNYFNSVISIKKVNNIVNNVKVVGPPFLNTNNKCSCS